MASDTTNNATASAQARPSGVGAAFALGWHIAELTHLQDDREELAGPGVLKQIINLDFGSRAELLLAQVNQGIKQMTDAVSPASVAVPVEIDTLEKAVDSNTPLLPVYMEPVAAAHQTLLTDLTALDYRLGKAYSLGAQLGETVILGYRELRDKPDEADLPRLFDAARTRAMVGQLRDLKTEFNDHAADAVAATLLDWSDTVAIWSKRPAGDAAETQSTRLVLANTLYRQGTIWRSLLSGEKEPTDYLHLVDYAVAIADLLGEYAALARSIGLRGPTLAIITVMVVVIAAGAGVLAWVYKAQVQAVYTTLIGLLATVGVTGATITAAVKSALTTTEDRLWETELSVAIANAIDMVPVPIKTSNVSQLRKSHREPPVLTTRPT